MKEMLSSTTCQFFSCVYCTFLGDKNLRLFKKLSKLLPFPIFSSLLPPPPFPQVTNNVFENFSLSLKFSQIVHFLCSLPNNHRLFNEADDVWNLSETYYFVSLLFKVRLFWDHNLFSVFFFFCIFYYFFFFFKFEMGLTFKTNINSFIGFISFWKVEKISCLALTQSRNHSFNPCSIYFV